MECIGAFLVFMVDKICKIIFTLDSLANLFTVIGLPLTVVAIFYAKKAFEHQQALGAWSLLAQKGTGDLGRKDALEFLHKAGKSLAGLDLSNAHLVGLKLEKANLSSCKFNVANLWGANFTDSSLSGAHFKGATLCNAYFTGAYLQEAYFNSSELGCVIFTGTDLNLSHFEGAALYRTLFKDANLQGANFQGAFLQQAHFQDANLTYTKFNGAKSIEYAIFENCFVRNINESLPTAPEGYEFVFEANEDGTDKTEVVDGLRRYYIKLIKTETKNP